MSVLNIGGITLIPPEKKIEFVTSRKVARFEVPGYKTEYQDMGQGEQSCSFKGVINEIGALDKARALEELQNKGAEALFIFGPINTKVIIESFNYNWQRDDLVDYEMSLIRVGDITTSLTYQLTNLVKQSNIIAEMAKSGASGALQAVATVSKPFVQGDCLRSIAVNISGNADDWQYIAMINRLNSAIVPDDVKTLTLPANVHAMEDLKLIAEEDLKKLPPLEV